MLKNSPIIRTDWLSIFVPSDSMLGLIGKCPRIGPGSSHSNRPCRIKSTGALLMSTARFPAPCVSNLYIKKRSLDALAIR